MSYSLFTGRCRSRLGAPAPPPVLAVDTFAGEAWLGVAAYRLPACGRGSRLLPGPSPFPPPFDALAPTSPSTAAQASGSSRSRRPSSSSREMAARHRPAPPTTPDPLTKTAPEAFDAVRDRPRLPGAYAARAGEPAVAQPREALDHFRALRRLYGDGGLRAELHHRPSAPRLGAKVTIEASTSSPSHSTPHALLGAVLLDAEGELGVYHGRAGDRSRWRPQRHCRAHVSLVVAAVRDRAPGKLAVGLPSLTSGSVSRGRHSGTDLVAALLTFLATVWPGRLRTSRTSTVTARPSTCRRSPEERFSCWRAPLIGLRA